MQTSMPLPSSSLRCSQPVLPPLLLQVASVVNDVYARATRNCYWVGGLWTAALRALDRFNASKQELDAMCKAALAAGMQVC